MTTDIIIPIHCPTENEFSYVAECISSILSFTLKNDFDIIAVVDRGWEGTENALFEYLAKGWITRLLRNTTQRGFTRTCNIGLEQSTADFAMLLNMDTVVSPGWLGGIVSLTERHPNAGVVGCKLIDSRGNINHAGAYGVGYHRGMNEPNTNYFEEEEVEWVTGAAFLISKKVRDTIGNLNESYPMWGSDREYCIQAKIAGFEIWYSPITILHYGERSTTEEIKKEFLDDPR